MKKLILISTTLALIFAIGSCRGNDGTDGIDGKDGMHGSPGQNGNANVIVSSWKSAKDFKDAEVDNSKVKMATVEAPELTKERLENSAILVYMMFSSDVFPLPYVSNAGGKPSTISYKPEVGSIKITRFTHDNSNTISLSSLLLYKYIIIPKETLANNKEKINWNNYDEVKAALNLKD